MRLATTLHSSPAARIGRRVHVHADVPLGIAAAVFVAGTAAALHYHSLGLTLTHYDARAHLVVARRILDSLTPGWQQIGAVWLPLPHVLNMLPVQVDAWYRSGASAVAISTASMALAAWALVSLIVRATGSRAAAAAAAALLLGNPNVLYLQSTPMTEPLLFGATLLAVELTARWIDATSSARVPGSSGAVAELGRRARRARAAAGFAIAAACMTRYEAWPITVVLIPLAVAVLVRRGMAPATAAGAGARLALYPLAAVILFIANSRWTVGAWFISSGFFVAENTEALGHPLIAWHQVRDGVYQLSGPALVWAAYAGALVSALAAVRSRSRSSLVLLVALAGAAALPCYAYYEGHPVRVRYGVPLVAAAAALSGAGLALLWRPLRGVAAAALVATVLAQAPPLDRNAPMIKEAQRDVPNMEARRRVTAYLVEQYDGRMIMASMGSLAHYVQDLSHAGFRVHDFLHEGNNELWTSAAIRPRGYVGWILIEERAEGGDTLFQAATRDRHFLDGFQRVAEGGGVALYRARD
jgi:hypothetical protein